LTGGEGTLGVVTKVSILTPPKLASTNVAFLACEDYESCQNALKEAKKQLGEILSAFEFIDRPALDMVILCSTRMLIAQD
jgi:D-2-hydroxyglutarate dehydrogenase